MTRRLNDFRLISFHLMPFQTMSRVEDTIEVRYVQFAYDLLNVEVSAKVQGVTVFQNGTKEHRLREFAFRNANEFPDWMSKLASVSTPPEYIRAEQDREAAIREAQREAAVQEELLTRRQALERWTLERAGVAS